MAQDWKFTWTIDDEKKAQYVYCVRPKATKLYKQLMQMLNEDKINRFKYERI